VNGRDNNAGPLRRSSGPAFAVQVRPQSSTTLGRDHCRLRASRPSPTATAEPFLKARPCRCLENVRMQRRSGTACQRHACATRRSARIAHLDDDLRHLNRVTGGTDGRLTSKLGCEGQMRDLVCAIEARSIPALREGDLRNELRRPRAHWHRGDTRAEHRALACGRAAPCCGLVGPARDCHEPGREGCHAATTTLVAHPSTHRRDAHAVLEQCRHSAGRTITSIVAGGRPGEQRCPGRVLVRRRVAEEFMEVAHPCVPGHNNGIGGVGVAESA